MKNFFLIILSLSILVLSLCSCSNNELDNSVLYNNIPEYQEIDSDTTRFSAELFSIGDSNILQNRTVTIEMNKDMSPLNALLRTLLSEAGLTADYALTLDNALVSDDCCFVFINGEYPGNEEWVKLEVLLCYTLNSFCNAQAVAIFLNGTAIEVSDLPIFPVSIEDVSKPTYITERTAVLSAKKSSAQYSNAEDYTAIFFMEAKNSELMYATPVKLTKITRNDGIKALVSRIIQQQYTLFCARQDVDSTNPTSVKLSTVSTMKNGKYSITVNILGTLENADQLMKQVSATLYTNIPYVDNVLFTFGTNNKPESFKFDDVMESVGTPIKLYYPMNETSTLESTYVYIASANCYNPETVLRIMLANTYGTLMPNELDNKLISVNIADGIAIVNFKEMTRSNILLAFVNSSTFYDSDEMRERLLIYSMVNTLTELPTVDSVMFYEDNKPMEPLLMIYTKRPLYRNVGLISG